MSTLLQLQEETKSMRPTAQGLRKELEQTQTGNRTAASVLNDARRPGKGSSTGSIFS
jgi:hypothetical protein